MPLTSRLQFFTPGEFTHPELVDDICARRLDLVREAYGAPLKITSDGRTPEENAALAGASPTSLHLQGRAFDLHWHFVSDAATYKLVRAIITACERIQAPPELELVPFGPQQHVHLGWRRNGGAGTLLIRAA